MVTHYIPKTLTEALDILHNDSVKIIAGGTDLMVQKRGWANTAPRFDSTMNIIHIEELNYIHEEAESIHIGSTTSLADILNSDLTHPLLKKAIKEIASPAIRNMATIAGNIGNASPAGDTLPILYVLDAKIHIVSKYVNQTLPIADVILGPRKTILKKEDIIKEIILPKTTFTKTAFVKVGGRKADAISKLSLTGAVTTDGDCIKDFRVAFGAVGPTMVRKEHLEQTIIGKSIKDVQHQVDNIMDLYDPFITPIDDQRSNLIYRKKVSLNLLKEFILSL